MLRLSILSNAVTQSAGSRRRYVPIRLLHRSASAVQALVFRTLINEFPEHIFVIPSKVLLKSYFTTVRESSVIYLPTEKLLNI